MGADRPAPEPAGRALRRRAVRRLAAHRDGAGGAPGRDPPAVRGRRRRARGDRRCVMTPGRRERWSSSATRCSTATSTGAPSGSRPTRRCRCSTRSRRARAPAAPAWPRCSPRAAGHEVTLVCRARRRRCRARSSRALLDAAGVRVIDARPRRRDAGEGARARAAGAGRAAGPRRRRRARLRPARAARRRSTARTRCWSPTTAAASPPSRRCARRSARPRAPLVWDPHPRGPAPVAGRAARHAQRSPRRALPRAAPGSLAAARGAPRARCCAEWRAVARLRHPRRARRAARRRRRPGARRPRRRGSRRRPVRRRRLLRRHRRRARWRAGALPSEAVRVAVDAASAFVAAGGAAARPVGAPPAPPTPTTPPGSAARACAARRRHRGGDRRLLRPAARRPRAHARAARGARRLPRRLPELRRVGAPAQGRRPPARRPGRPRRGARAAWPASTRSRSSTRTTRARCCAGCARTCGSRAATTRVADLPEAATLADWGGRAVIVPYVDGPLDHHD